MTQAELAAKLNYTDKAVSKWERAESVPDIAVLKSIADLFGIKVDDLIRDTLPEDVETPSFKSAYQHRQRNRGFITGMCVLLVWLIATLTFTICTPATGDSHIWLCFVYAVPVSMIVWLVFNTIWFNSRRNFLIISLLMWSVLACIHLSLLVFGVCNLWLIYTLGIPGELIILLWSRIRGKTAA